MTLGEIGAALGIFVAASSLIAYLVKIGRATGQLEERVETLDKRTTTQEALVKVADKAASDLQAEVKLLQQAQGFAEKSMTRVEQEIKVGMDAFKAEVRSTLAEIRSDFRETLAELRKR